MTVSHAHRPRRLLAVAVLALALVPVGARSVASSPAADAHGATATDGVRTLRVSQATQLDPAGQTIRVTGTGYDTDKGVYVALCVIPPPGVMPTPCGGGVDMEGRAGASQWISSNPPSYGVGLAEPYGPGGSFDTTFSIGAVISPTVDCRTVRCAVLTRNDHSRSSDRSQDLLVPVTFASPPSPAPRPGGPVPSSPSPAPAPPPPPAPSSSTTPSTTPSTVPPTTPPAPPATIAVDGMAVSDGTRTLRADRVAGLDPDGESVTVRGSGFDVRRGVFVSLCLRGAVGEPPEPCATGDRRAVWVSSDPPAWGEDLAVPYRGDGFEADLELVSTIDAETVCTASACAIVVRSDDPASGDRSLDLALPVTFGDPGAESDTDDDGEQDGPRRDHEPQAAVASATDGGDDDGSPRWVLLALTAVLVAGAGVMYLRRRGAGRGRMDQPGSTVERAGGSE